MAWEHEWQETGVCTRRVLDTVNWVVCPSRTLQKTITVWEPCTQESTVELLLLETSVNWSRCVCACVYLSPSHIYLSNDFYHRSLNFLRLLKTIIYIKQFTLHSEIASRLREMFVVITEIHREWYQIYRPKHVLHHLLPSLTIWKLNQSTRPSSWIISWIIFTSAVCKVKSLKSLAISLRPDISLLLCLHKILVSPKQRITNCNLI